MRVGCGSATVGMFVDAEDPGGIATFGDGLETSWNLLVSLGQVLVLLAGALLPFIWVPVLAWFGWRYLRRRAVDEPGPASDEESKVPADVS